jgi:hypothetical protein
MGRAILTQPDQFAWQVFDAKTIPLLNDTYRIRRVSKVRADTLEELAGKMEGVDPKGFLAEVARFNTAIRTDIPFDRQVLDGRCTEGLPLNKSNWAQAIDTPLGNTFLNARTLVNASLTLAQVDNKYYFRVMGRNLTDERYRIASQNVAGLWLNSNFGAPRYFGAEIGVKFRGP